MKTQKTQPAHGDPVDIPIPTRGQFFADLAKVIGVDPAKVTGTEDDGDDVGLDCSQWNPGAGC